MSDEEDTYDEDDGVTSSSSDESIQSFAYRLASSQLDGGDTSIRKSTLLNALKLLEEDTEDACEELSEEGLGVIIASKCHSVYALHRTCRVFTKALFLQASLDNDDDALYRLADALCCLLIRYAGIVSSFSQTATKKNKNRKKNLLHVCFSQFGQDGAGMKKEYVWNIIQAFMKVARASASTTDEDKGRYASALSCAHFLMTNSHPSPPDTSIRKEMIELLLKHLFPSNNNYATTSEINMSETLLQSLSQEEFETEIAPTMGLKLRGKPEIALNVITQVLSTIADNDDPSKNQIQITEDIANEGTFITGPIRQLKSTKIEIRELAVCFLVNLIRITPNACILVINALVDAIKGKGGSALSLSSPEHREGAYSVFRQIGGIALKEGAGLSEDVALVSTDAVLTSLSSCLGRESGESAKDMGCDALSLWLTVALRSDKDDSAASVSGVASALTFLASSVSGKEFRLLFSGVLLNGQLSDQEEIKLVSLLFGGKDGAKFEKGLVSMIDNCVKKHTSSSSVAQLDGILAIYLLLHNSKQSSSPVPPNAVKVLSSPSSFLYCRGITDTSNDSIVSLLPKAIHLYCEIIGKDNVKSFFMGKKSSGAARAMAACAMHPTNYTTRKAASSSLLPTLETSGSSVDKAKIGNAVLHQLHILVNNRSVEMEANLKHSQGNRENREIYHPCNETPPVSSGRSTGELYDSCGVQKVANLIANSMFNPDDESSAGSTDVPSDVLQEILGRSLVLAHVGCTSKMGKSQVGALAQHTSTLLENVLSSMQVDRATMAKFIADCACGNAASPTDTPADEPTSAPVTKPKKGSAMEGKKQTLKKDLVKEETVTLVTSPAMHSAACTLLLSLGQLAGNFDPEYDDPAEEGLESYVFSREIMVKDLPPLLTEALSKATVEMEALNEDDISLYRSAEGDIYKSGESADAGTKDGTTSKTNANAVKKRQVKAKKTKGDFGASVEEEEWERQMKKEIAEKKRKEEAKASATAPQKAITCVLSPEEKKLLSAQTKRRLEINGVLMERYPRALKAMSALCVSDVEVGNECLPTFATPVLRAVVSRCVAKENIPPLGKCGFDTLKIMAGCVYEIDDVYALHLAHALSIAFRKISKVSTSTIPKPSPTKENGEQTNVDEKLVISAFPSPCPPAATFIFELEEYADALSGPSISFVFPILQAALTGPRTVAGTEVALNILHRHLNLLTVEQNAFVTPLRRDMALSVLELLSHDRSQTFTHTSPYEVLVGLYTTNLSEEEIAEKGYKKPSSTDLAPLLGESGALGGKNCRIASMMALAGIASEFPKLIKGNPLIENRIWMNCFDKDMAIQTAARRAWRIATGDDPEDAEEALSPPSKMYAISLVSLLSVENESIASAAAAAFAHAVGMHPDTTERAVLRLCNTYIDAFPTPAAPSTGKAKSSGKMMLNTPQPLPPAKKLTKPLSKPLKKKTSSSASAAMKIGSGTKVKKVIRKAPPKATPKPAAMTKEQIQNQFFAEKTASSKEGEQDSPDKVRVRQGVLRTVSGFAQSSNNVSLQGMSSLKILVGFLMAYANADTNEQIRTMARNAIKDIVAKHGSSDEAIEFLLPHFEGILNKGIVDETCLGSLPTESIPRQVSASDRRKEGAVVALGSVALHLKGEGNVDKIDSTIDMLIATLRTPSEDVQASVAASLSKLMKKGRTQERVETIVSILMNDCIEGQSLAIRRGSAYGVSAVVKGSGIASLKKYDIVKQLEESCTNGPSSGKEGALFVIELLCDRLGLLFEPYVIVLLPSLLKCFSDSNDHVRTAAGNTAGLIMSKLSAHGVKLVMPAVLTAFDEPEWRTKQASIHMLGSMSHCAPKQLASCLPKVVPKLTEAFSDTHPKVKTSAEEALNEISKVIRNPEIASLSAILTAALIDPSNETKRALEGLIETEFLHAIDAPSLALIVPVLYRGLRDRSTSAKRYGALIAGNMCTMISDPRDFTPYLTLLLPSLKTVLLDPIPDVRSTAAKALGSLARGLGEEALPDLRPWLIDTLKGETGSTVERSGAAQGLTEVLIAGGNDLVESVMMDEILPLRSHPKPSTREGVLWVLTFLPSSLGQAYAPLIDPSLPALLSGLSDEAEMVREVAMRAGRVLIRSHGKAHVDKILPSLEERLSDDDWRIRVASLTLLGDLLSMIGGTTVAKGDADTQEDIRQAERAQAQIALTLGVTTRRRVLSRVYLARSDTAAVVRQIAVQVWKTVVSVTPRTVREILHVLVEQIVTYLGSGDADQTQVAGRCLGDIVMKLGDAVLPEIIPVLRDALYRGDEHERRGACVGLAEVIACSSKDHINKYLSIIIKAVQDALCDEFEGVRSMAAGCFQSLYNLVGSRALDEVVPVLLAAMENNENNHVDAKERALHGLTGILSIRSRELLPYLVPRLMQKPITNGNADALGSIARVTGTTIHMHFNVIIPALISELGAFSDDDDGCDADEEREQAIRSCTRSVCASVDQAGVNWLVSQISNKCSNDKHSWRKESAWMLGVVVEERKDEQDFYEQIPLILRELLYRLNDDHKYVLLAANAALNSLTKNVPAEELVNHLEFGRNLIASIVSDSRRRKGGVGDGEFLLPAFNMRKGGLEALLPIYQRGILYGDANIREVAAAGLGELISITANKFLAGPFIIKMTGPLLRIVGDRNPPAVKIAIVQTLGLILKKGGPALRAFVPQFQTTFVKALSDPSRQVRQEATKALALLMPLSTRIDPLIKELVSGSLGNSNAAVDSAGVVAVQTATLEALATVLRHGGKKAKLPDSIPSALEAGKKTIFHDDDGVREGAAKVVGAACGLLGVDVATEVLDEKITNGDTKNDSVEMKHGKAHACYRILASSVGTNFDENTLSTIGNWVKVLMKDDTSSVREAACVAIGSVLGRAKDNISTLKNVESSILKCMDSSENMEVHKSLARGLCVAVRMKKDIFRGKPGLPVMDGGLRLAMSGSQRVQVAYNDFLWLALNIGDGEEGLDDYTNEAVFENSKSVKSLATKVLGRIKEVAEDN